MSGLFGQTSGFNGETVHTEITFQPKLQLPSKSWLLQHETTLNKKPPISLQIELTLAHVQSVSCSGLAHTCACDQQRRVGKATTSPIAGTVLATSSVARVRAPSPCQVRSERPAGGQAADSFYRGAFERGVGIAAADP